MCKVKEELLLKSDGVEDCVKWLKEKMKETKKELDASSYGEETYHISLRLQEQLSIKTSLEKYMKKLRHESDEIE